MLTHCALRAEMWGLACYRGPQNPLQAVESGITRVTFVNAAEIQYTSISDSLCRSYCPVLRQRRKKS